MRVRILETQGGKILIRIFTILLFAAGLCETAIATNSVQTIAKASSSAASTLSLSFPANTTAGNLILVGFDFDSNATLSSVSDSQGNLLTEVGSQLTSPGGARSRVYFAKNIKGGPDTVTVNLSANSAWIEVYVSEYSGVDTVNPIDGQAGASGSSTSVSSGNATTTVANDVIYSFCLADSACTVGSGFTARSTFNNNLIEDKTATTPGSYAATGFRYQRLVHAARCAEACCHNDGQCTALDALESFGGGSVSIPDQSFMERFDGQRGGDGISSFPKWRAGQHNNSHVIRGLEPSAADHIFIQRESIRRRRKRFGTINRRGCNYFFFH